MHSSFDQISTIHVRQYGNEQRRRHGGSSTPHPRGVPLCATSCPGPAASDEDVDAATGPDATNTATFVATGAIIALETISASIGTIVITTSAAPRPGAPDPPAVGIAPAVAIGPSVTTTSVTVGKGVATIIVGSITSTIITSTTATTTAAGTTGTAARVICPSPGWCLASLGGGPLVGAVAGGSVVVTSGGGDGGGISDETAAALTTGTMLIPSTLPSVMPPPGYLLLILVPVQVMPIDDCSRGADDESIDADSSLLPMWAMPAISDSSNCCGRGRYLGAPRETPHYHDLSPPLPTVAVSGAAERRNGCPAALADALALTAYPRPTPVGLLSALQGPQPGPAKQHGVRVGSAPRATSENVASHHPMLVVTRGHPSAGGRTRVQ